MGAQHQITKLDRAQHGFVAALYEPAAETCGVDVVVLGGSEGGIPDYFVKMLGGGFPLLALAYHGLDDLPSSIERVALEYFAVPLRWMRERSGARQRKLALVGISKGAELALLLASRMREVDAVVAFAPSSVVFEGIGARGGSGTSSWSSGGEPVAFVPLCSDERLDPTDFLGIYSASLEQAPEVEAAAIAVERINGPLMLLSGGADRMWPSTQMAESICERLRRRAFPHESTHHSYEAAGHVFSEYVTELGGTAEANRAAGRDAAERVQAFLERVRDGG